MFPNAQHAPASSAERAGHQPVAGFVRGKFLSPEGHIVPRLPGVSWATMPEATVHKHREAQSGKDKIRFAEHGPSPPPAGDAVRAEHPNQSEFRILVSMPANPGHHFRTLGLGENVRHGILLTTDGHRCTRIPTERRTPVRHGPIWKSALLHTATFIPATPCGARPAAARLPEPVGMQAGMG